MKIRNKRRERRKEGRLEWNETSDKGCFIQRVKGEKEGGGNIILRGAHGEENEVPLIESLCLVLVK